MNSRALRYAECARWSRREALLAIGAASLAITKPALGASATPAPTPIHAIAVDRKSGLLYLSRGANVYRSADRGERWDPLRQTPDSRGAAITALTVSAAGPLYAAGPHLGVLRNDGEKWTSIARGLPSREVLAIAAHATLPETVYAYIAGRGIFRSEDAGAHWRLMDTGPRGGLTQFVHSDMAGSMKTGWLLAVGPQGVRLSMDCFCGWRSGGDVPVPARAITYELGRPSHVVAGAGPDLFDSSDGGQTWSRLPDVGSPVDALLFAPGGVLYAFVKGELHRRQGAAWSRVDA